MRTLANRIAALALAAVVLGAGAGPAHAAPPFTLGPDGTTASVYNYDAAIRERVYIPQAGIDQDRDGVDDDVAIEIMRPAGSGSALKVPAIIDPSPYYSTVCRTIESQCIGDPDNNGVNDKWPLFYDNYFVPRGYAVILAEANGTANSSGCPLHGGPGDIAGEKSVIDWLNGRVAGFSDKAHAHAVVADWHNGRAAMIGKSYDGTLANGVAATGVEGLTTIVPQSAIDDWYAYSRMGGIRFNTNYPASLSQTVTDAGRRPLCLPTRNDMNLADGDETGDVNDFWSARNYLANVGHVKAAVFATHGLQDDNVRLDHLASWWAGLTAAGVPRKLWLLRGGHVDPFDARRAVWVDTLHRWFDHWLLQVDNGIMDEPRVDIEDARDTWSTYADWPLPGTEPLDVYLRGTTQAAAGDLGLVSGGAADTLSWTDVPSQSESTMMTAPTGSQAARRVFLSPPLQHALRISGTPVVDLHASLSTTQSNLGALIVDYGAGTQVTRSNEGISNTATRTCWGDSDTRAGSVDYSACYLEVTKPPVDVTQWRVTKGILDSANRTSLTTIAPVTIGTPTRFTFPLIPQEHVFPAGHQIGIVLVADYNGFPSTNGTTGSTVTLDARQTRVSLPVVGGYRAAVASGAFAPDTTAPSLSGVPGDRTVAAGDAAGVAVGWPAPAATDDQDPQPAVGCDPASGSAFAVGATTVTCTAKDASGNAASRTFTVTVTGRSGGAGDGGGGTPGAQDPPSSPAGGDDAGAPPVARPAGGALGDRLAPALGTLALSGRGRQARLGFTLSEAATLTVTLTRRGAKRALKTVTVKLAAGRRTVTLRSTALRPGRYTLTIRARDAAGNVRTVQRTLIVTR